MRVDAFDFDLPPERIALRPARPRDSARLLVVRPGAQPVLDDRIVRELPDLLAPGDALVVNDTRVLATQLTGRRLSRGEAEPRIDVTLMTRLDGATWRAFARPGRKLQVGDRLRFGEAGRVCLFDMLDAEVTAKHEDGAVDLAFSFHGPVLDEAVAERGRMPLPPYIAGRRAADEADDADYQTMFATREGAVAAPTAGLHFTPDLIARLQARGVASHTVTLHVGPGTFLPMKVEDTADHRMHAEWGEVTGKTAAALNETRARGGRIVAVGTTSLRLIESAVAPDGTFAAFTGETDIFLYPGRAIRSADLLLTNFHLPRSTLFMLVAAFSGLDTMKQAYAHAIARDYRFYSYGDACLLQRART